MIINSSAVGMAANTIRRTKYTEENESLMRNLSTGGKSYSANSFSASYENAATDNMYQENSRMENGASNGMSNSPAKNDLLNDNIIYPQYGKIIRGNRMTGRNLRTDGSGSTSRLEEQDLDTSQQLLLQLRQYLYNLRNRISMMIGRRSIGGIYGIYGLYSYNGNNVLDMSSGSGNVSVWRRTEYCSYTYEEQESMSFETVGKAVTADGRTIEFNMQLEMSRSYQESVEVLSDTVAIMTDPLVISLDSNPVSVSDQKWRFDIDGDGTEDSISQLSAGSGYLVYDKNQDGVINNGTEMFGAATGNGFAELSAYDEDGNGWIDENDSIYEKLSVWIKDDTGRDRMETLKEANVGAIYLGSVASEYALKSDEDNQYNAQIRRSGMYLSEDGNANTIQQLDMVKALIS